jgi:hypothetical protein
VAALKANVPIIDPKTLPAELRKHLSPFAVAIDRYRQIFTGQVSIADNMFASFVSFDAQHGELTPVANPLKSKAKGFTLLEAMKSDGTLLGATATADLNRSDGRELGITVNYATPYGIMARRASANQTGLGSGAQNNVLFGSSLVDVGGLITYNSGTGVFTFAAAGVVQWSYGIQWDANTYTQFRNGVDCAGVEHHQIFTQAISGYWHLNDTVPPIEVSVGSTGSVHCRQDNAGAATRQLFGSDPRYASRVSVQYVAPPSTQSGQVLGIVWGG